MKAVIRGHLIAISPREKKHKQLAIVKLSEDIKMLEQKHKATCSKKMYKQLLALEAINTNKIQKYMIYAKQQLWRKTPKTLKNLAWRVKNKRSLKLINAIRDPDGSIQINAKDILQTLKNFDSSLYTEHIEDVAPIQKYLEKP